MQVGRDGGGHIGTGDRQKRGLVVLQRMQGAGGGGAARGTRRDPFFKRGAGRVGPGTSFFEAHDLVDETRRYTGRWMTL